MKTRTKPSKLWLSFAIASCILALAASSSGGRRFGRVATTGHLSLTPGHVALLTVADIGNGDSGPIPATLEIIDVENQVLARVEGELGAGKPLSLEVRGDRVIGTRLPVRARVVIPRSQDNPKKRGASRPILSFELMNDGGDVTAGVLCPFVGGRGIEFNCGCIIDDLTLPE